MISSQARRKGEAEISNQGRREETWISFCRFNQCTMWLSIALELSKVLKSKGPVLLDFDPNLIIPVLTGKKISTRKQIFPSIVTSITHSSHLVYKYILKVKLKK